MKNIMMRLVTYGKGLCLMLVLLTTFASGVWAQDSNKPWTTAASAGTVDTLDTNEIGFGASTAFLRGTAAATAMIRYNVVAVDGLFVTATSGPTAPTLRVRFIDNGSEARVFVRLWEVNLNNGSATSMMTLDSNNYPVSTSFQTRSVSRCSAPFTFDFVNKAYFIEAQLIKTGSSGNPRLGIIQVDRITVCIQ